VARRLDPIVMVPYDPAWSASAAVEVRRLETSALGPLLVRPIEHIGSTSVPGLCAKPIVDLLAVVAAVDVVDEAIETLPEGWVAAPEPGDAPDRRRSFCAPSVERRSHHLHVVEDSSGDWRGWLAFRDHLCAHPEVAAEYGALKQDLARRHGDDPDDRAAYRAGKAGFIGRVTRIALAEEAADGR
jgi:GrpB-like predicted nucleotidyltransferase (UPF0157 family)